MIERRDPSGAFLFYNTINTFLCFKALFPKRVESFPSICQHIPESKLFDFLKSYVFVRKSSAAINFQSTIGFNLDQLISQE